jgi:hypothetical protein
LDAKDCLEVKTIYDLGRNLPRFPARERNELSRDSRREILYHCARLRAAVAQRQSIATDEEAAAQLDEIFDAHAKIFAPFAILWKSADQSIFKTFRRAGEQHEVQEHIKIEDDETLQHRENAASEGPAASTSSEILARRVNADTQTMPLTVSPLS